MLSLLMGLGFPDCCDMISHDVAMASLATVAGAPTPCIRNGRTGQPERYPTFHMGQEVGCSVVHLFTWLFLGSCYILKGTNPTKVYVFPQNRQGKAGSGKHCALLLDRLKFSTPEPWSSSRFGPKVRGRRKPAKTHPEAHNPSVDP